MNPRLIAASVLLLLTACSGSPQPEAAPAPSKAASTTASPTASPPASASAESVAAALKASISSILKTVTITEDNDPNNAIGRPGKYEQAVSIYDSRVKCAEPLDITCGAKVEVFPDHAAAQARADYIADLAVNNPILGSEYHYVSGPILLRVTGELKPSEAKDYESAFMAS